MIERITREDYEKIVADLRDHPLASLPGAKFEERDYVTTGGDARAYRRAHLGIPVDALSAPEIAAQLVGFAIAHGCDDVALCVFERGRGRIEVAVARDLTDDERAAVR